MDYPYETIREIYDESNQLEYEVDEVEELKDQTEQSIELDFDEF